MKKVFEHFSDKTSYMFRFLFISEFTYLTLILALYRSQKLLNSFMRFFNLSCVNIAGTYSNTVLALF